MSHPFVFCVLDRSSPFILMIIQAIWTAADWCHLHSIVQKLSHRNSSKYIHCLWFRQALPESVLGICSKPQVFRMKIALPHRWQMKTSDQFKAVFVSCWWERHITRAAVGQISPCVPHWPQSAALGSSKNTRRWHVRSHYGWWQTNPSESNWAGSCRACCYQKRGSATQGINM